MRPLIFAANWKMHKSIAEALAFVEGLQGCKTESRILVAAPLTALAALAKVKGKIEIGAQNCHEWPQGAMTGEVSALQCKDAGADFVIVGHSERRTFFAETPEKVGAKLQAVVNAGLTPLLCCGETLEERRAGLVKSVLQEQIHKALLTYPQGLIVAYEPVWAIGTGVSASLEMIEEAHRIVRHELRSYGVETTPILYGGSVHIDNCRELFSSPEVDGALLGKASLELSSFLAIIERTKGE